MLRLHLDFACIYLISKIFILTCFLLKKTNTFGIQTQPILLAHSYHLNIQESFIFLTQKPVNFVHLILICKFLSNYLHSVLMIR